MVRSLYRAALVLWAFTASAAVQGPPVYTYTGTAPSGPCVGQRVWIDYLGTGIYYCNGGTWAAMSAGGGGTPGGANTQVQFNNSGAFGGSANLTWVSPTLTFGAGSGSDSIKFTTNGARLHLGTGTTDYLYSDSFRLYTPGDLQAANFRLAASSCVYFGSASACTGAGATNLAFSGASTGITFNNNVALLGTNIEFQLPTTSQKLRFGTPGTNAYFYGDNTQILTPGALTAASFVGPLTGNASTATALSTTGAAGTFWANNNTWQTPAGGSGGHIIQDEGVDLAAEARLNFTGAAVTATDNPGSGRTDVTIPWPTLNQVGNPTTDKSFTFPSGAKALWTFTGGTDAGFSIDGDGAFSGTGDLVHIHKTGTGASAGADALHVEVTTDTTMVGVHVTMPGATNDAFTTNGKVTATGGFVGNASTATALSTAGTANQFWKNGNVWGQPAFSDLSGSATAAQIPTASTTLGGVKMAAACGAGNHVASIVAGELTCTADAGGGGGANALGSYLVQTATNAPVNAQVMASLATGIVKNTTTTGVQSIATAGTDYGPPTSGNATGLIISTTGTGAHTAYAGTTCTNQFTRALSASGAATCAGVAVADHTATGTPSATTFLRGDNTWATPAGGGGGVGTLTRLTATWASSAVINTIGIIGTGGVPMTSPSYGAASPFSFRCLISTTRPATTNGPRYGVTFSSAPTRMSARVVVGLAAATDTTTKLLVVAAATCATGCSTAMTAGTVAQVMDDVIEGTGVTNLASTISINMAPSAAAANTAQIGSYCVWY